MRLIDPEQERVRLSRVYSGMSDEELLELGQKPAELTEWGLERLRTEMGKRGLPWQEQRVREVKREAPSEGDVLVLLGIYTDKMKAMSDKNALDGAGIEAHFFGENTASLGGMTSWVVSDGIRLLVRSSDFLLAEQLLKRDPTGEPAKEESDGEGQGSKPVVLRVYRDMTAALVDRMTLESAGIECYLFDDNLVRLDWFISNAIGGVKLAVAEDRAQDAEKILSQALPDPDGDEARGAT